MRGETERQADLILAGAPDSFVPADHPIRRIKPIVDAALARLSPVLDRMYSKRGRPSIPPEHLLQGEPADRALLCAQRAPVLRAAALRPALQVVLDLNISDEPFDASTFSKNCERLLEVDAARAFFAEVVAEARHRADRAAASARRPTQRGEPR